MLAIIAKQAFGYQATTNAFNTRPHALTANILENIFAATAPPIAKSVLPPTTVTSALALRSLETATV